jgi:hypothetical protein
VILRQRALQTWALQVRPGQGHDQMDYIFLVDGPRRASGFPDGEVQIFADYRLRVAAAVQARREVLAEPNRPFDPETLEEVISRKRDEIKRRRRDNRCPGR